MVCRNRLFDPAIDGCQFDVMCQRRPAEATGYDRVPGLPITCDRFRQLDPQAIEPFDSPGQSLIIDRRGNQRRRQQRLRGGRLIAIGSGAGGQSIIA